MTHEQALKPIDSAIWEMGEALEGLANEDLWVRPNPRLLSVGEILAHVAYSELRWIHRDLESAFAGEAVAYYPDIVARPSLALPMTAEEAYMEVKRIHESCKARMLDLRPDLSAPHPLRDDWTWGYTLEYTAFHVAYHTGQIYSLRHLMGHETVDN